MAKKVAAPESATKPAKVARKEKVVVAKAEAKLVSFSVSAVIPTQQYGNIQPRIEVTAPTIEEARALAMPHIDDLYRTYAELPLNGREPRFYGKVTEEVKVVAPAPEAKAAEAPVAPAAAPAAPEAPKAAPAAPAAPVALAAPQAAPAAPQKPEPVLKAEKAIEVAQTLEGIVRIGQQIEQSVKIPPEFKDALAVLVIKKRKQLGDTGAVAAK